MATMQMILAGVVTTGVLLAGTLIAAPPASAASGDGASSPSISAETIQEAVTQARAAHAVVKESINADGSTVVAIAGANGTVMELSVTDEQTRLSAGSDSYGGTYVGFNAFDQNLIISGAMTAIAAGMCALGPAVCAVANVAAVLASTAIGSGGGIRCGTKSLRVYPISHKKPRCA